MWDLRAPERSVPFCAVMFPSELGDSSFLKGLLKELSALFGAPGVSDRADFMYGPVDFSFFSRYYDSEIGGRVGKIYTVLGKNFPPDRLSIVKIRANALEKKWAKRLKISPRPVNIDPGYLTASKLVLASTKNYYHRIYLGRGIYAELTLYFRAKQYRALPWTYPDYADENFRRWLSGVRNSIKGLLF